MARTRKIVIILTVLLITGAESARILAYIPTPSISHQVIFRPITQALAKRGHEVTVVTTDPVFLKGKTLANLTEIDVHDISYNNWVDLFSSHTGEKQDILLQIKSFFERFATCFDIQMDTPQVQNVIKNKDRNYYDLLLIEACNRPLMGLTHIFDAPAIQISSFGATPIQYSVFGAPTHPLLYSSPGRNKFYNLGFLEKGVELFKHILLEYLISRTEPFDHDIMKKHFGEDVPKFDGVSKKVHMLFINEHPLWADNHPVPPGIVYIGGIHQSVDKELPTDLKEYIESSKNGVIYVSFGTNVLPSLLPPEKIQVMTKVFSQLPYNILWKWDKEELHGQSKNIKISKWFPQTDILRHPNVKLFITQGGLQSTDETIDAGVPVIGIPMLGDQWYNVEKYVLHKIGLQLDITTLTEKDFKETITTVIEDKSYKNNILRLRAIMRDYPIKPVDNAVWWIEHVIKFGGNHLKGPAAYMSWVEYYEIKLVLVTLIILVTTLVLLVFIVKKVFYSIWNKIFRIRLKIKSN